MSESNWIVLGLEIYLNNTSIKISLPEFDIDHGLGLKSSKSRLFLTANRSYFNQGLLRLKCQASIYSIWKESVQNNVREDTPQLAPVLGSTSSQSHTDQVIEIISSSCNSYRLKEALPYFLFQLISMIIFLR
ncbi:hypothetical protein JTB14_036929 [Gonioctena quinquepunctata]|nr:hypothetical protein JTB14_036929 [Gonioctena quinquepunctata]